MAWMAQMPADVNAAAVDASAPDAPTEPIDVFTDGACLGNPGPGGWGAILRWRGHEKELSGGEAHTTNNRMELAAAIAGLSAVKRPSTIRLFTDSTYLRDGITRWVAGWKRNGWRTADRKPVKNADLWLLLDEVAAPHEIQWCWVKGHAGHLENERADALATAAAQKARAASR